VTDNTARFVTAEELSDVLDLPRSTIYRLSRQRDIPAYQAGRQYRYSLAEVLEALKRPAIERDSEGGGNGQATA